MTPLHTGHFNPRSPWEERREQEIIIRAALEFQSTLSVGRATKGAQHTVIGLVLFQSTPSARRATLSSLTICALERISIHALREEGDSINIWRSFSSMYFNPRPPRGGRHAGLYLAHDVEGDFNPRPPRGGRQSMSYFTASQIGFQSTPSARRATVVVQIAIVHDRISIHALREEGDAWMSGRSATAGTFQSTPSARRATQP